MKKYLVIVEETATGFSAYSPDLPGCVATGSTHVEVETEMQSAREYYRLMERRYREGQALQIELTDARTQLTAAEQKQSLALFNVILRGVELERAEDSFKF